MGLKSFAQKQKKAQSEKELVIKAERSGKYVTEDEEVPFRTSQVPRENRNRARYGSLFQDKASKEAPRDEEFKYDNREALRERTTSGNAPAKRDSLSALEERLNTLGR